MLVKSKAKLLLALLDIAEGLTSELDRVAGILPASTDRRLTKLGQKAWDALGHPSIEEVEKIRKLAKGDKEVS